MVGEGSGQRLVPGPTPKYLVEGTLTQNLGERSIWEMEEQSS